MPAATVEGEQTLLPKCDSHKKYAAFRALRGTAAKYEWEQKSCYIAQQRNKENRIKSSHEHKCFVTYNLHKCKQYFKVCGDF